MTIVSANALHGYFQQGDTPTSAQFADLIGSFHHRVSAAGTAAMVSALGADGVGHGLFLASNTAAAQAGLGGGTVGIAVFEQPTTASAQAVMGGGTVGRLVFEQPTTASAQTQLGGGAAGITLFDAETTASARSLIPASVSGVSTAQAIAGAETSAKYLTPNDIRHNPFGVRAYATFSCAPAILQSKRVSSVAKPNVGHFDIKFTPALPTSRYTVGGVAYSPAAAGVSPLVVTINASSPPTVSACSIFLDNRTNGIVDPNDAACLFVFCSGA